ncbi:MAG: elongation factor P [Chloroflexota bacterium]|nr:elongation factor P [Chloroflexota bacterium]
MIPGGDLKKGVTLRVDGKLMRVLKTKYNKPGRGTAYMDTQLLDLSTGNTVNKIFDAEEKLDDLYVEQEPCEYLYDDGDLLHFMNKQTYEQYEAAHALFGDDIFYLKENMELELRVFEGKPIDYVLPTTMTYTVAEAEVAVVGDSAGSVNKKVKTETGLSVQVPIFINEGETIKVDTRDGSYVGRA